LSVELKQDRAGGGSLDAKYFALGPPRRARARRAAIAVQ